MSNHFSIIDEAKNLKRGSSGYIQHEGCTPNNKLWIYHNVDGYGYYCNKCGTKGFLPKGIVPIRDLSPQQPEKDEFVKEVVLPKDFTTSIKDFPNEAKLWLYKSDIRDFQIQKYGIGYSKELHRVILPVYSEERELLLWQGRGLLPSQTKYHNVFGYKKNQAFFKSWVSYTKIHQHTWKKIILVEDVLSVIKLGRECQALAALGTSLSEKQYNYLSKFDEVVVWYDDDRGGLNGGDKIVRRLSMVTNCYRVKTKEDPKKLSYGEIKNVLNGG